MRALQLTAVVLLVASGIAGASAHGQASEPPAGFAGTWRISGAEPVAADADHPAAAPNAALVGATVEFRAGKVVGPSFVGCDGAYYETVESPPQGLFQGFYADADEAARRARELGLSTDAAPTLRVACDTGSFDYHRSMAEQPATLLIMLDRVIYTLQRD